MVRVMMTAAVLERVATRFQALADPARLQLLQALRSGERSVGDLVEATGLGQANVSKHLRVLHGTGFVTRRKEAQWVLYQLADDHVNQLCDLMCGRLQQDVAAERRVLANR